MLIIYVKCGQMSKMFEIKFAKIPIRYKLLLIFFYENNNFIEVNDFQMNKKTINPYKT